MLLKLVKMFFGLCVLGGFIFMFGTVGSSDLNLIDFETLVIRSLIGLAVTLFGYLGLKWIGCEFVC